jgi:hypothetical protein
VLNAAYVLSNSYRTQLVGAELSGLRLLTEISVVTPFSLSTRTPYGIGLGLALGAGFERTHLVPVKGNAGSSTVLFGPRWLTTPVLSASVRLNYEFSRHWTAALGAYVNAALLDVSCELETSNGTQRVLTTRRLRPGLLLELGWQ